MGCLICGTGTAEGDLLCSRACAGAAEDELGRNRERLGELRQRRAGPPCSESHELMDRNSQLQQALRATDRLAGV